MLVSRKMKHRIKWREASGILSDKRIPIMLKGKLYNSSDASMEQKNIKMGE